MSSVATRLPVAEGPGSVAHAPNLPEGFADTFASRYVDTGRLRLHAVIGGDGPPLLLVHGWPQTWYQYRLVMPALARDFQVIAVDQRGIGLSDKPEDGYDTASVASDLVGLMDALGHQRFALLGFDTGFLISLPLPRITRTGSRAWSSVRASSPGSPLCPLWSFPIRSSPCCGTSPSTSRTR
jgi:pimeloyl-ACP methyl ester carboxylesterase